MFPAYFPYFYISLHLVILPVMLIFTVSLIVTTNLNHVRTVLIASFASNVGRISAEISIEHILHSF